MDKVEFKQMSQETYNNLDEKLATTFYRTTDENNLYLGENQLNNTPPVFDLADFGINYILLDGKEYSYSTDTSELTEIAEKHLPITLKCNLLGVIPATFTQVPMVIYSSSFTSFQMVQTAYHVNLGWMIVAIAWSSNNDYITIIAGVLSFSGLSD